MDAEVARIELQDARQRINHLEESLLGKQTALDQVQKEFTAYKEQHQQQQNGGDGESNEKVGTIGGEVYPAK